MCVGVGFEISLTLVVRDRTMYDFHSSIIIMTHFSIIFQDDYEINNAAKQSLVQEEQNIDLLENKKYKCHACELQFSSVGALNNHWICVHENKGFKCHFCEKTFGYASHLKTHIKTIHENLKEHQCRSVSFLFCNLLRAGSCAND